MKNIINIKIVYCQGAKWFDRVNGNSYNNTKVIDGLDIKYLGFEYGYGRAHYYRALEYFNKIYGESNFILVDLGIAEYTKRRVKNNDF